MLLYVTGNPRLLNLIDVTKDNTKTLLNQELSQLVNELVSDLPAAKQSKKCDESDLPANPKKKKKLSPAMQKRHSGPKLPKNPL